MSSTALRLVPILALLALIPGALFALDRSEPVIVYTGNIGSAQALEPCVRAMQYLSNEEAVLRLVGEGDEAARLRELTEQLGLSERVEFVGLVNREEVPRIMNEADIGLAPIKATEELAYAIPTKVYEYLACELPVIITGRGEVRRFIEASGGGIHAESDPQAIADALDPLLEDPDRRLAMGEAGYHYVVENYDREDIAERLDSELTALSAASSG